MMSQLFLQISHILHCAKVGHAIIGIILNEEEITP